MTNPTKLKAGRKPNLADADALDILRAETRRRDGRLPSQDEAARVIGASKGRAGALLRALRVEAGQWHERPHVTPELLALIRIPDVPGLAPAGTGATPASSPAGVATAGPEAAAGPSALDAQDDGLTAPVREAFREAYLAMTARVREALQEARAAEARRQEGFQRQEREDWDREREELRERRRVADEQATQLAGVLDETHRSLEDAEAAREAALERARAADDRAVELEQRLRECGEEAARERAEARHRAANLLAEQAAHRDTREALSAERQEAAAAHVRTAGNERRIEQLEALATRLERELSEARERAARSEGQLAALRDVRSEELARKDLETAAHRARLGGE